MHRQCPRADLEIALMEKPLQCVFRNFLYFVETIVIHSLFLFLSLYVFLSFSLSFSILFLSSFRRALFTSRYRESHGICALLCEFNFIAWTFGNTPLMRLQTKSTKRITKNLSNVRFFCVDWLYGRIFAASLH